jgi:hypothetical protein
MNIVVSYFELMKNMFLFFQVKAERRGEEMDLFNNLKKYLP